MRDAKNLKPVRSKEEARKRGRNGGIASGVARRKKRIEAENYGAAIRSLLKTPFLTDLATEEIRDACAAFGLKPHETGAVILAISDFCRALHGDENSMQRILSTPVAQEITSGADSFVPTNIYVLPSSLPGEEVVIEEGDGEDP